MKQKGFTLIELLAVIVILAIIALIATPVITNLIEDTRKGAFENSAYGLIKAGELSYTKDMLDENVEQVTFTYVDGVETSDPVGKTLNYNGSKPENGTIIVNIEGQVSIAVHNGRFCVEKGFEDSEVILSEKAKEECNIDVPITVATRHLLMTTNTCNPETTTGPCFSEMKLFPFTYPTNNYKRCDGSLLSVAQYPTLFSLFGTTYGGNGTTTFALPNLNGSSPLAGLHYHMAIAGNNPDWNNGTTLASGVFNYFTYQPTEENDYIGEIILADNVNESDGKMLLCDGRILLISDYPTLFPIFTTLFGGNGTTTFALPDLTSATPPVAGFDYYISISGAYPTAD